MGARKSWTEGFSEIKDYFDARETRFNKKIDEFIGDIKSIKENQENQADELAYMKVRMDRLERAVKFEQYKEIGGNLMFFNLNTNKGIENETNDDIIEFIIKIFKAEKVKVLKDQIDYVKRIYAGNPSDNDPVLLKLTKPSLKKDIFEAAKDIGMKYKVYIANDLPYPQRQELRKVKEVQKQLLEQGITSKIVELDLLIDGYLYTWKDAQQLLKSRPRDNANHRRKIVPTTRGNRTTSSAQNTGISRILSPDNQSGNIIHPGNNMGSQAHSTSGIQRPIQGQELHSFDTLMENMMSNSQATQNLDVSRGYYSDPDLTNGNGGKRKYSKVSPDKKTNNPSKKRIQKPKENNKK